jgi:hypothetical protein
MCVVLLKIVKPSAAMGSISILVHPYDSMMTFVPPFQQSSASRRSTGTPNKLLISDGGGGIVLAGLDAVRC